MSHVTHGPIDVHALIASVSDSALGGTAIFLGSVRSGPEDGPVASIEYSAYEEMLESEFEKIASDTMDRWPGIALAMVHRLGRVPVGEPSIAVIAGAPHRAEAFDACRHAIEETKKRLPVWKKESFEDGTTHWRENETVGADSDERA